MYRDWMRDVEDLSTAFAGPTSEGCMGLQGWDEGEGVEVVVPGGKEIIGIMSENSSVGASFRHQWTHRSNQSPRVDYRHCRLRCPGFPNID
jgi:hypothetical protein